MVFATSSRLALACRDAHCSDHELAAPDLMPAEVANILRRAALAGDLTADAASLAHGDLLELRVEL